jgi:hypothetical protein
MTNKRAIGRGSVYFDHGFAPGDEVVALRSGEFYVFGAIYTVTGYNDYGNLTLDVPNHEDDGVYYNDFELVQEPMTEDLVYRLRKRAEIRRQISTRKSVQEGKPDRIADLLDEAATELEQLRCSLDEILCRNRYNK